jgi:hypothetical protein
MYRNKQLAFKIRRRIRHSLLPRRDVTRWGFSFTVYRNDQVSGSTACAEHTGIRFMERAGGGRGRWRNYTHDRVSNGAARACAVTSRMTRAQPRQQGTHQCSRKVGLSGRQKIATKSLPPHRREILPHSQSTVAVAWQHRLIRWPIVARRLCGPSRPLQALYASTSAFLA